MPAMTIGRFREVPNSRDMIADTTSVAATIQVIPDILFGLFIGDEPPQTTNLRDPICCMGGFSCIQEDQAPCRSGMITGSRLVRPCVLRPSVDGMPLFRRGVQLVGYRKAGQRPGQALPIGHHAFVKIANQDLTLGMPEDRQFEGPHSAFPRQSNDPLRSDSRCPSPGDGEAVGVGTASRPVTPRPCRRRWPTAPTRNLAASRRPGAGGPGGLTRPASSTALPAIAIASI